MNTAVMFGKATDNWETPQAVFDAACDEFAIVADAAATMENRKCDHYLGPDHPQERYRDALSVDWCGFMRNAAGYVMWLNPPYSRCAEFVAKAAREAARGCWVVMLIPSRTDTRYWHAHIWDAEKHQPRPGVEVRFIKGRLKFGTSQNSAPFPSVVVIFRPVA